MKLGEDVLLEIMDIVRTGISQGQDISQMLRDMDLIEALGSDNVICLSIEYLEKRKDKVWDE